MEEPVKKQRVLSGTWQRLAELKPDEVKPYLQQIAQQIGQEDVQIRLAFGSKEYLRLLGDTYLALKYKEIAEPTLPNLINRALSYYDLYLTQLAIRRRQSKA